MPFFQNAFNVDARGGTYNVIEGDQVNHYVGKAPFCAAQVLSLLISVI